MITESVLVEKIRTLLNEARDNGELSLITDDTLMLDKYIAELLPEAVLFIQMNKKEGVLNGKKHLGCKLSLVNEEYGVITLPEDYVRLVSLKLDIWKRPCYTVSQLGSFAENAQTKKYMRAGNCSPVCIESPTGDALQLNVYPASGDSIPVVEYFLYEARYDSSKGLATNNDSLLRAVAYQCAGLVCNVFEKYDAANAFFSLAAALCNNNK